MYTCLMSYSKQYSVVYGKNEKGRYYIWSPIRLTIMTTRFAFNINDMQRPVGSDVVRLLADDIVLFL